MYSGHSREAYSPCKKPPSPAIATRRISVSVVTAAAAAAGAVVVVVFAAGAVSENVCAEAGYRALELKSAIRGRARRCCMITPSERSRRAGYPGAGA